MTTVPVVYGSMISPYVRKVLITLQMKHIAYDLQELIPFVAEHKQKILALNPLGKVPVYQEGDFLLADSSVICAYLEKKHPANPLYPAPAESFARCLWYEEYADNHLIPTIATVFFHTMLATRFNVVPDRGAVKLALESQLPEIFNYLDHEIGAKKYLVANQLSLADISMISPFINFEFAGHAVDAKKWKNLSRYVADISLESSVLYEFNRSKEKWAKRTT